MELVEEVGESSSPPRSSSSSLLHHDIRVDVYNRLVRSGFADGNDVVFRKQLFAHFDRLPASYELDINLDRVEDVLLHQKILVDAKNTLKRPVFHVRFLEYILATFGKDEGSWHDANDLSFSNGINNILYKEDRQPANSDWKTDADLEACSRFKDLNFGMRNIFRNGGEGSHDGSRTTKYVPLYEVIFSTLDKPKLLSQLSALLSEVGLNIREAHVFSTTDGFSLDVFVVDGWPSEDIDALGEALKKVVDRNKGSLSGSPDSSLQKSCRSTLKVKADWEIDTRLLKFGEKIASGSCGDLYRGAYLGQDVAVKVTRSEHLSDTLEVEFSQEVSILSKVQHRNVVQFIGACTKPPQFCIVTEYMSGGSLYDFLHKHGNVLEQLRLVKFAIDICRGMKYLHEINIIHRDLKTGNLLLNNEDVVKVADFGVARIQGQGVMTAETGTYRWMAPEVINHQPYDQKADVFSFAIVLWELSTSKIPYEDLTPLQAALGVRKGLRPPLPEDGHPKLLSLMLRCWDSTPRKRPSFKEITAELECILIEVSSMDTDDTN